jgi:hypothetical protein
MPLEFRAVTGEGSEVGMALHLSSLHKQPLKVLVDMLPDQVDPMATCAMLSATISISARPGIVSEAVVGANAKSLSDFTRRVSAVTRSVIRTAASGRLTRLTRHRCM